MSFRFRLYFAFLVAALVPLALLALGVRRELTSRLEAENRRRAEATAAAVRAELDAESGSVDRRLRALASALAADNRFRVAAVAGGAERRELLDLAGGLMRQAGLAMLQLQDSSGRILSSGHFRNQFDRLAPDLPQALAASGAAPIVARVPTADSAILVLTRAVAFRSGGAFTLVGGAEVASRLHGPLAGDPDLALTLLLPGAPSSSSAPPAGDTARAAVAQIALPYLDLLAPAPMLDTARVVITKPAATLAMLRRGIDRWSLAALAATMALATLGAAGLSARISRPIARLAERTATLDLDRLDQSFPGSERQDEVGTLARGLEAMTERLRLGASRLREVERRLATGDLARQVNHDVKNGLVPIRNVVRHLAQVARDQPSDLPRVLNERLATLEASLTYLDTLARNYARLSPAIATASCDVNHVVEELVRGVAPPGVELRTRLASGLPAVSADPLALRRVLENLVANAVESFGPAADGASLVTVTTERPDPAIVRMTVGDTGPGMDRAALERAFGDFRSTKPGGTGLGLSIVRRLVLDLGGTFRIETAPGAGTRAVVELPASAGPGPSA